MNSEEILIRHNIRPTANRLVMMRALAASTRPVSVSDLEVQLETLDKSTIFRALTLFLEHDLVHSIEDGSGVLKYELCKGEHHSISDMHIHFHCEKCGTTFCMEEVPIPEIQLPEGYHARSATYLLSGYCPKCNH